jgi:hypothetical protein
VICHGDAHRDRSNSRWRSRGIASLPSFAAKLSGPSEEVIFQLTYPRSGMNGPLAGRAGRR